MQYIYLLQLGTLTSWNPLGHSRPVTGLLYLLPFNTELNKSVKHWECLCILSDKHLWLSLRAL